MHHKSSSNKMELGASYFNTTIIPTVSPPPSRSLPPFLMGERPTYPVSPSTSQRGSIIGKPLKGSKRVSFGPPSILTTGPRTIKIDSSQSSRKPSPYGSTEKSKGPPTQGLFDMKISPGVAEDDSSPYTGEKQPTETGPFDAVPFFEENAALTEFTKTWVTVFGFPSSAAMLVLQEFSVLGNIIDKRLPTGKNNWMHLRFQSWRGAYKALRKNAKVLSDNMMIAVIPCNDDNVIRESFDKEIKINRSMLPNIDYSMTGEGTSKRILYIPTKCDPSIFYENHPNFSDMSLMEIPSWLHFASPYSEQLEAPAPLADDPMLPRQEVGIFTQLLEFFFGW